MIALVIYLFMFVLTWLLIDRYTLVDLFTKWKNKTILKYEFSIRKTEPDNMPNENCSIAIGIIGIFLYVVLLGITIATCTDYFLIETKTTNIITVITMLIYIFLPIVLTPFAVYFLNINFMRYFIDAHAYEINSTRQDLLMQPASDQISRTLNVYNYVYEMKKYNKKQYIEMFGDVSTDSAANIAKLYQVIHLAKMPNKISRYLGIFVLLCASPFNIFVFIFPNKKQKKESNTVGKQVDTSTIKRILK